MALLLKLTFIRIEVYVVGFLKIFFSFFSDIGSSLLYRNIRLKGICFFYWQRSGSLRNRRFGCREVWLGSTLRITVGGREWKGRKQDESEGKLICEAVLTLASGDPTWKFMLRRTFRVGSSPGTLSRSVLHWHHQSLDVDQPRN